MAEGLRIFHGISEEEIREHNELFERGGVGAVTEHCGRKINGWKTIPLNIGIIGNSGTGKSSFINAIRGLTGDDEGAARVGVTETTVEPTPYVHPVNELLKFWDLPGVGTQRFPKEGYLQNINFANYDFFLIISSNRFTDNDKWIAKEITENEKQFFFIRTKIHGDLQNEERAYPRSHNKLNALNKIKNDIRMNLEKLYDDRKVFLIDNYERMMYDFDRLEERIIEDFPSLKREALILSLSTVNEAMVRKKAQTLRKYHWISCVMSATIAIVPIPATSIIADITLILTQSTFYFHQFGLDEKSLENTAKITSYDVNILRNIVKERVTTFLTKEGIMIFIRSNLSFAAALTLEEGLRFVPFVGWTMSSLISYRMTYRILDEILQRMEDTALCVLETAVNNTANQLLDNNSEN